MLYIVHIAASLGKLQLWIVNRGELKQTFGQAGLWTPELLNHVIPFINFKSFCVLLPPTWTRLIDIIRIVYNSG